MGGGNPIKSFFSAPIDAVKSLAQGDIGGVLDAAGRAASGGTLSFNDLSGRTAAEDAAKKAAAQQTAIAQQEAAEKQKAIDDAKAEQQAAKEKAAAASRAVTAGMTKTNYTTALGNVGSEMNSKKKTLLGG